MPLVFGGNSSQETFAVVDMKIILKEAIFLKNSEVEVSLLI